MQVHRGKSKLVSDEDELPPPTIEFPEHADLNEIEANVDVRFPESEILAQVSVLWDFFYQRLPFINTPEGPGCTLPNGDTLTWFQTLDFVRILWGQVIRYYFRMSGHAAFADEHPQGHLLQYDMGYVSLLILLLGLFTR